MNPQPEILLIEDDPGITAALKKELQAEGYRVATATRGDEGLNRAREHSCDVALTDLKMPGLSGLELIEQLHAAKPKLPIIMMTAFGTTETAIEATKLGAYDYLLKPFDMSEMFDLVAQAVASSRLMSEPLEIGAARSAQSAVVGNSRLMCRRCCSSSRSRWPHRPNHPSRTPMQRRVPFTSSVQPAMRRVTGGRTTSHPVQVETPIYYEDS